MGQDIIITSIQNDHARKVIARLICQKQSISLQKALDITLKPPFIFLKDASDDEILQTVDRFGPLGITFKKILSEKKPEVKPLFSSSIRPPDANLTFSNPVTTIKADAQPQIVHHLPIDEIPVITKKPEKKIHWSTILIVSVIILLPVLLIIISTNKNPKSLLSGLNIEPVSNDNKSQSVNNKKNINISAIDKAISRDYADSASEYSDNSEMAIKFYKLAISFNKYNYRAWYGLMNTYYSMNELKKADKVRDEMIRLFGDNIFNITTIVEPFGKIRNAELRSDSSYYLEYSSNSSAKKQLVNESYQIIRALKPGCNCVSIALFASESAGRGLIVHIKKDTPFYSLSEFENAASFTFLE